jgi:cyclopropane fatty-acyl-phospholipid synthase-like methyltransferase
LECIPSKVLDIGGGWGRLGMAWKSIGVETVGITDSIEQLYLIQNQYLSSVPETDFVEILEENRTNN